MASKLDFDPDLLARAQELSGERTKKAAVTKALEEFIARRSQKQILDLFGKLDWDPDYDYKAERDRVKHSFQDSVDDPPIGEGEGCRPK